MWFSTLFAVGLRRFSSMVLLLVLFSMFTLPVFAVSDREAALSCISEAERVVADAYEVALDAEGVGANVSGLMLRLNEAADLIFMAHSAFEAGNFDEAIRLADLCGEISSEVRVEAQRLRAEADSEHAARFWWSLVGSFVGVAIVVSASVLGYVYFKRLYYRRLLKMRPRVEQV